MLDKMLEPRSYGESVYALWRGLVSALHAAAVARQHRHCAVTIPIWLAAVQYHCDWKGNFSAAAAM